MASSSKNLAHLAGSYDSEFEFDSDAERKRKKYEDLAKKEKKKGTKKGHKRELEEEYDKEEGRKMRHRIISMNAFDRHKLMINNYLMYYSGSNTEFGRDRSRDKTDMDVIRENHKFLWNEDDEDEESWAKRLAKKYYDKLFKEYCISDLSRYKENKIAMRWRIEKEVQQGKGQFICGNKKCNECQGLRSWEVNFAYMEDSQKKNALVKLRLCADCSYKLNYHHRRKEIKPGRKKEGQEKQLKKSKTTKSEDQQQQQQDDHKETQDNQTRVEGQTENAEQGSSTEEPSDNIWSGPAKIVEEKSREEEFDEYFADMLL